MTTSTQSATRAAWIVGVLLFASYAYFYQAGGWNQNSRFALVRAVLERHTLQIDAYQLHTGDKALFEGHYYSDKPPGTSLMVMAPVAVARVISRAAGVDPESFPGIAWTSYVAAVTSAGVFTMLAALIVMWFSLRMGFSLGASIFAATAYGLTGPAWAFATLFMSHGVTACCLIAETYAAFIMDAADPDHPRPMWPALLLGLSGGWAVVSELQAGIPVVVIALTALVQTWRKRRTETFSTLVTIAFPALTCAAVMGVYNALAFKAPLHFGYSSEEGFEHLRTGFFGITYPEWWRVRELLVGRYRGLLPLFPLVTIAPIGLWLLARDSRHRVVAATAVFVAAYYLLLNASYFYWEGGWVYAPRQLTPAFPFLALGFAPLWDLRSRVFRTVLTAGWLVGAAVTLVAVSTNPQPPSSFRAPMRELLWPAFNDGDLSLNHQTFVHGGASPGQMRGHQIPHAAWNLGEIAGLQGKTSLMPLLIVWIAAGVALLVLL